MQIRLLTEKEIGAALEMVMEVFNEFEAPDYSKEGVETFNQFILNPTEIAVLKMYGAFDCDRLIGIIAMRGESHISMFFVKKEYQNKGVGRKLFDVIIQKCDSDSITVNASPYAVKIYHHLGFIDTNVEQTVNGISFTPMVYRVNKEL